MSVIRESIARNPGVPGNYSILSRWLRQLGRAGEAMFYVNKLHESDPENLNWRFALCQEYIQLWDRESAGDCLAALVADFPDYLDAKHWLALVEQRPEDGARCSTTALPAMSPLPRSMQRNYRSRMAVSTW